jgi:phage terminase Nu1 subunit (DNA packaging protein)
LNQPKEKPGTSLYNAQQRRTVALAEREELRNAKSRGELVSREAVSKDWFSIGRAVRDRMQNIPVRVAPLCAAEKNPDKIFAMLQKEIDQALEGLAS